MIFKPVGIVALAALNVLIDTSMIGCCACNKSDCFIYVTRELYNHLAITQCFDFTKA